MVSGPAAPTNLQCSFSSSNNSISLTWNASTSSTVTNYKVYRSTDGGSSYTLIATVSSSTLGYTDTNITLGTTYTYKVTSYDSSTQLESVTNNPTCTITAQAPTISWSNEDKLSITDNGATNNFTYLKSFSDTVSETETETNVVENTIKQFTHKDEASITSNTPSHNYIYNKSFSDKISESENQQYSLISIIVKYVNTDNISITSNTPSEIYTRYKSFSDNLVFSEKQKNTIQSETITFSYEDDISLSDKHSITHMITLFENINSLSVLTNGNTYKSIKRKSNIEIPLSQILNQYLNDNSISVIIANTNKTFSNVWVENNNVYIQYDTTLSDDGESISGINIGDVKYSLSSPIEVEAGYFYTIKISFAISEVCEYVGGESDEC